MNDQNKQLFKTQTTKVKQGIKQKLKKKKKNPTQNDKERVKKRKKKLNQNELLGNNYHILQYIKH